MEVPDWRMRMLYIHPDFFPDWLPSYVKEHDRLLPYFDLPAQHADKEVLAAMGRTGTPSGIWTWSGISGTFCLTR
jgi:ribosomal protein S12 methylthiotransferase